MTNHKIQLPHSATTASMNSAQEFSSRLKKLIDSLTPLCFLNFINEMEQWKYAQGEFGRYFGKAAGYYLAAGEEFDLTVVDYNLEIDWNWLNDFMDKNIDTYYEQDDLYDCGLSRIFHYLGKNGLLD